MPPFRWLHVAGLDLETVVPRTPVEFADLCENAPFDVLERIVEAALEHRAQGVLLCPAEGRDGLPAVFGLAALEALHDLVDSLCEQEIAVIIAVCDNASFWRRLADRNQRTYLLGPGDRLPFHDRHGRLCADVHGLDSLASGAASSQASGLTIGVAPSLGVADLKADESYGYDYLALGAGPRESRRINRCLAHCPGPPRPTSPSSIGPHGATLINVDGAGVVETEFISTARVRFEAFTVTPDVDADLDDLALRMLEHLSGRAVETSERGWIVHWTIRAASRLLDRLETYRGRAELLELLPDRQDGRRISHRLTIAPPAIDATDIPFAAEFNQALYDRRAELGSLAGRTSLAGIPAGARFEQRIAEVLAECDEDEIIDQARRVGLRLAAAAQRDFE